MRCEFGALVAEIKLHAPVTDGSVVVSLVGTQGRCFEAKSMLDEGAVAKITEERTLSIASKGAIRSWEAKFQMPLGVFQNGLRLYRAVDREQRVSVTLSLPARLASGCAVCTASEAARNLSGGDTYRVYYNAQVY